MTSWNQTQKNGGLNKIGRALELTNQSTDGGNRADTVPEQSGGEMARWRHLSERTVAAEHGANMSALDVKSSELRGKRLALCSWR
jgi:hypothetical protein